jgi:AcrR family transcriptional regulator
MKPTDVRIRDAAIQLFATQGFAGTGIRDLAKAAGITTATLYHHVSSKDDLLDEIVGRSMSVLLSVGRYWQQLHADSPTRLAGLVGCHVTIHALAPREAVVVDRQLDAMRPESRKRAIKDRDAYERTWQTVIAEGVEAGDFAVNDPKLAARALLGATTAVADWYRPGGTMSIPKLAAHYVDFSMASVRGVDVVVPDLEPALQAFRTRWES